MGLYRDRILPWLMDRVLSREELQAQRFEALRAARGLVLEIGFGGGASLGEYPAPRDGLSAIVAVDNNPGMIRRARRRAPAAPVPLHLLRASATVLPFRDGVFDTVTSTWTLCSISDPAAALAEMHRVLRPGGRFLFLEHGLAEDARLARRQALLTPLHRRIAGGCRLDVPIDRVIAGAGFRFERLERYEAGIGPRALKQMYRGIAVP